MFFDSFCGCCNNHDSLHIEFWSIWPEWAPGPNPSHFAWIPLAMAGFVIFIFLSNIIKKLKSGETSDSSIMYTSSIDTYSAEDVSKYEASGYTGATYIRTVPNFCNYCGSQMDEDSVEWIDSMTFTCPYCGEKQRAGRKAI